MRSEQEFQKALELIRAGINDCEIGRRLDIPRGTIRDWRHGLASASGGRTQFWNGRHGATCFRCEGESVDEEAYAYLLGAYLGDGCLSPYPRGVYALRIACDLKYPDIINEIATHIVIVRGVDRVGFALQEGCVDVNAYWKHWPCVFPQHGPGRKHERHIELHPWQRRIVAAHPKALIRGLIHSDGNRHINPITRHFASGTKHYRYPRYMFKNASGDILDIFTDALDLLGIRWTPSAPRVISVARREDVAFLDTFVGPKS
ncbi:MAG TPA: helix-turn-helix domain-containing protein [Acidimicrobiia bacterium]|nr:helix-turn-helix domain-containing protein [Acidimicrobiia bacterium]